MVVSLEGAKVRVCRSNCYIVLSIRRFLQSRRDSSIQTQSTVIQSPQLMVGLAAEQSSKAQLSRFKHLADKRWELTSNPKDGPDGPFSVPPRSVPRIPQFRTEYCTRLQVSSKKKTLTGERMSIGCEQGFVG